MNPTNRAVRRAAGRAAPEDAPQSGHPGTCGGCLEPCIDVEALETAAQIRRVGMNLVTDASEAVGPGGGTIRVVTCGTSVSRSSPGTAEPDLPDGDYVQLEVSDTGIGMTSGILARIFDPYFTTK